MTFFPLIALHFTRISHYLYLDLHFVMYSTLFECDKFLDFISHEIVVIHVEN